MSEVRVNDGFIINEENLPIRYSVYEPVEKGQFGLPVILFIHGFKGARDWGAFPEACKRVAEEGFAVVAINLSHCGTDASVDYFDRLDLFATQTFGRDQRDIEETIEAIRKNRIKGKHSWDFSQIGMVGHSKGGHSAIVAAATIPHIRALVTWSSVANYLQRWNTAIINDFKKQGLTIVKNGRTRQEMPLHRAIYDELIRNDDLNAIRQMSTLEKPCLFIHGEADESVPSHDSEELYEACASMDKELRIIPNTGHTFGASHPFNGIIPEPLNEVLKHTISWFKQHLLP